MFDRKYPGLSLILWLSVLVAVCFIVREVLRYNLPVDLIHAISEGFANVIGAFAALSAEVGATAAGSVVACVGIPVGVVAVYKVIEKHAEKKKAWASAVGVFLYPIFVDFLKDALPDEWLSIHGIGLPGAKIALAILFSTLFMVASVLQDQSSAWGRVFASVLYLIPTFIIIGYLVRRYHPQGLVEFFGKITALEMIGLVGFLLTAGFGIYLSRSRPAEAG